MANSGEELVKKSKANKGTRRMPRLSQPKKDVLSCEKPGGGAQDQRTRDIRMGEPVWREAIHERGKSAN